ncbi:YbaB/EbfC family nucleoid-associated protein [Actinoplanes sp. NPDC049265]|uniref:YbaB/EbfC family nucleoid-associated protein n=1 Tax=Actinoplanes sp. NPDC049265 TaxID=3363902 RepID=UPI0037197690
MFDGDDLDAAEQRVDDWQAGLEQRAAEAREMASRLAELSASARSEDKLVTVTVDATGVTGLELAEGIRKQPAADTAAAILATIRAARGKLTEAVTVVAEETVGADSETGQAVIASYAKRNG